MVEFHRMVRGLSHLSHVYKPHRLRPRIRSGAPTLAAVILCAMLGGCAGGFESVYNTGLWAEPGKYDYLKCPDLVRNAAATAAQEKKLMELMAKADQEAAGPIINVTVYRAQLEQARAQRSLLERTAREKNCDLNPPAPKPNPPAAKPNPPTAKK